MFTLLHALIQAYVLTMLVSTFYGESTEKHEKKPKAKNMNKMAKNAKNNNIKPYERTAMTLPVLSYVLNFRSSSFNST